MLGQCGGCFLWLCCWGLFLLIVELSLNIQWKYTFGEAVFPLSSR